MPTNLTMRIARMLVLCLLPSLAWAQPVETVHRFQLPPFYPAGGLVEANDGFLYGTTSRGEGGGAIYRVPVAGGSLSIVARFSRGVFPDTTPVMDSDGVLYGTTARGGDTSDGTIYRFDPATSTLTMLHNFNADSAYPSGRLTRASDGLLYGTTLLFDGGHIYALDPTTGNYRTIHVLAVNDPAGQRPFGGLTEGPDGGLYGVTDPGSVDGNIGTIIRVDRATGVVTGSLLQSGRDPVAGLTRTADGMLYGVTKTGGSSDTGTIFRFDPSSGIATAVHQFGASGPRTPLSRLVEAADGSLYGTSLDAAGGGAVFRLRRLPGGAHALSVVHTLQAATDGTTPHADLVLASSGFVYGAAASDGPLGGGTVFRFDSLERGAPADPAQFTIVHAFANRGPGWRPLAPPVRGSDGGLYGLTNAGGANGRGDAYRVDPATGVRTVVGPVPTWPLAPHDEPVNTGLVPGGDGALYAAIASRAGTEGRILRVVPGTNTVEAAATVPLPLGPAGFLSGLAAGTAGVFGLRGTDAEGLVLFRLTPATGALTTIASLTRDAAFSAPLLVAGDGKVYVGLTTFIYSGRNPSTIFQLLQIDPSAGVVRTLVSQTPVFAVAASPVLGSDGSVIYGIGNEVRAVDPATLATRTVCALPQGYGNAIAIKPDLGSLYVICSIYPTSTLYSCAMSGGAAVPVHTFDPADGDVSPLAFSDGYFYGVTEGALTYDPILTIDTIRGGTLFRVAGVGNGQPFDPDGDGLSSTFESAFGLSETSSTGDDGASGDPDGDGLTNLQEQAAGTHPRGVMTRYLAEGANNAFFRTQIALGNASLQPAVVLLRFQTDSGAIVRHVVTVPPTSRGTVDAGTVIGLENTSFSTVVESSVPITVDRTMTWDASGYGSHREIAMAAPATTWYFAEGSTSGEFALFYLLQNPQDTVVTASVRYLRPLGLPAIVKSYTLPAHSRTTIVVDAQGPELASTDVSAAITATAPIIAERAMYRDRPGQPFAAGHASAGVTAPALEWFLAEGATGSFFDLFVLVANPNPTPATITAEYLLVGGGTYTKAYSVPADGRLTIWVDDEILPAGSGQKPLAAVAVSTTVRSTNAVPIIVERTMWWPGPETTADFWYEAHNAPGATAPALRWGIASGDIGYPDTPDSFVLIANPGAAAGRAEVRVYGQNGNRTTRTFELPAKSRTTVGLSTLPGDSGVWGPLAVVVESVGPTPVPIVVESASYASPGGVQWARGSAALAEPLP